MSTKTILKKIAVVAVAALAFGGVSAVTANAADATAVNFTGNNPSAGTQVNGAVITLTAEAGQFLSAGTTPDGSTIVTYQARRSGNNQGNQWGGPEVPFTPTSVATDGLSMTTTVPLSFAANQYRIRVYTASATGQTTFTNGWGTKSTDYVSFTLSGRSSTGACLSEGAWELAGGYSSASNQVVATENDGLTTCVITSPIYKTVAQGSSYTTIS
ncbi:MAG: hypothetical protein F2524_04405, partial [Actinobacteria bacterium]|nr:hypothetical protein [Actinomycetota bacterium]